MTETPETIYLIPGEDVDGAPAMVWCDDPAPGEGMKPEDAVKYVRAGSASAIERDVAFRQRDNAYEQLDKIRLKWSSAERENRELADRIEELETVVKVFRGCVETGGLPAQGSPCHKMIHELVGEREND